MKRKLALILVMALATSALGAQKSSKPKPLKPPKGSDMALVVFEDLQCPDCARAEPLVQEAARTYNLPVVIYDFPLPRHAWAFEASLLAKYFGTKSRKLGDEFRDYVFKNQAQITPLNLRGMAEKFAEERKVDLPFVIDPQGQLAAAIRADVDYAKKMGVTHTPTIYVVNKKKAGSPFVEVVDRTQLFQMIDQMKKQ
jgi:protein-disulfide isomerase